MEENKQPQREEFEEMQEGLVTFANQMRQQVGELKELANHEVCLLKDEGQGLWCEVHSRRIPVDQLLNICATGFKFLKEQRENKNNSVPSSVG